METIKNYEAIDSKTGYSDKILKFACEKLEEGLKVHFNIMCMGSYTREKYEERLYIDKIKEIYGDRLVKDESGFHLSGGVKWPVEVMYLKD